MRAAARLRSAPGAACLAAAALAACQAGTGLERGASRGELTAHALAPGLTRDLALTSGEDASAGSAPVEQLDAALLDGLRDAGFATLAPQYVRMHAAEAAHPRAVRIPGASVLALQVLSWDERLLPSRGLLEARVQLTAFAPDGAVAYRGVLEYAGRLSFREQSDLDAEEQRARFAAEIAERLVERMPAPAGP